MRIEKRNEIEWNRKSSNFENQNASFFMTRCHVSSNKQKFVFDIESLSLNDRQLAQVSNLIKYSIRLIDLINE